MEPIGVDGEMEAVRVHHYCSALCREDAAWRLTNYFGHPVPVNIKLVDEPAETALTVDEEVCDWCGRGPL